MRTRPSSHRPVPAPAAPKPAKNEVKATPKRADRFEAAGVARKHGGGAAGVTRDPKEARDFVAAFDASLGVTGADLAARRKHMTADASSFLQANPALFVHDLRGAFAPFADLTGRPAPEVTVDVDPHLDNFGALRGPDGKAVWGLNDFDQAARGSPAVDLERLAASAELRARAAGLSEADAQSLVGRIATAYAAEVGRLAAGGSAGGAYLTQGETRGAATDLLKKADDAKRKDLLDKLTSGPDLAPHFKHNSELKALSASDDRALRAAVADYGSRVGAGANIALPPRVLDVCAKLGSGGSSYGLPRYYALVANADPSKRPVVLELKAAPPSPLSSGFDGKAVVDGMAALGGRLNPDTGWTRLGSQSLLVREVEPEKSRVDVTQLGHDGLEHLVDEAATVLARAHARTPADARALKAWLGGSPEVAGARLATFARLYADQVQADLAAVKKG